MIWFTSDLHLGHEGVIKYCARPWANAEEMNRDLIRLWNHSIAPTDTVYCLGDVSFQQASRGIPLVQSLKGKKILVKGNHDHWSNAQYLRSGFCLVVEELLLDFAGQRLRMSHYPYWPKEGDLHKSMLRYKHKRPYDDGGFLLCGHVHEVWKQKDRQINVGVDVWNYRPVSGRIIESLIGLRLRDEIKEKNLQSSELANQPISEHSQKMAAEE
jgi:calcineurin-like phosphoesterase family protein